MMDLQAFFAMGGYGFYVWTSYGICCLVLVANVVISISKRRQFLRQLARKQKRQKP